MAEDEGSDNKTEAPTPRRREKAREDGQVAKSMELSASVMLLAGAAMLATFAGNFMSRGIIDIFRTGPTWITSEQPSFLGAVALIRIVVLRMAAMLAPLGIGLAVVAVAVGVLQSRGVVSWKPTAPDLSRINPIKGFGRIFGAEALINLVKSTLKLVVLGLVGYLVFRAAWPHFIGLVDETPREIGNVIGSATFRLSATIALAFLAIGVLDYGVQFYRMEQKLKMARHEVIQEHREQEGDPHIKARIRQLGRQRTRQRMLSQVAKADVVITNPTHIAVALKYDPSVSGAPMVLAMGQRKLAERIKQIAKQSGVPTIENKPLARALLATAVVGAPIPPALYVAIAEILAFVYRTRRKMPSALAPTERSRT